MRPEKQFLLDEIKDRMVNTKAFVLARYRHLAPNLSANFRTDLAKTGGVLEVVKKRILVKAAQAAGITLEAQPLDGHIAIIFAEQDPIPTTKAIFQFCQENEQILHVIGGRFEGAFCSAQDVEQISKLPGKDAMRSQFLATLEAPLSQVLSVMESALTSVMYCIENHLNKKEEV